MNKITKEQALEQLKHIRSLGVRYGINLTTIANNIERYITQPSNAQVEEALAMLNALCGFAWKKIGNGKILLKQTMKSYDAQESYNLIAELIEPNTSITPTEEVLIHDITILIASEIHNTFCSEACKDVLQRVEKRLDKQVCDYFLRKRGE